MNRIGHCFSLLLIVVILSFLPMNLCNAADQKAQPTIDKTSLLILANKQIFLLGDRLVWKWTPYIEFKVNGPLKAGSQVHAEYSYGGKPWLSYICETGEINEYGWWNTKGGSETDPLKSKASTYTGIVNFTIRVKNPVENTDTVLYAGKFNVKKFHSKHAPTPSKDTNVYYVDYDWSLPFGLLTYAKKESVVDWEIASYSPLLFYMWFKGSTTNHTDPVAYVYFNGKKIGDTASGGIVDRTLIAQNWDNTDESWSLYRFHFSKVWLGEKKGTMSTPDVFKMWKNAGDYEIKVLWGGELARSAKWTTAPALPDTGGVAAQLNAKNFQPYDKQWTNFMRVIPVKIIDNQGIKYNKNAWQTEAYFGNPLKGFNAP